MTISELRDLFEYNRWAHEKTLEAASTISAADFAASPGSPAPSVKNVLQKLLAEEVVWLSRWEGHSLAEFPDYSECANTSALLTRWSSLWNRQTRFMDSLSEDELNRPISIRMADGIETVQPLSETMTHVVNQASALRGKAALLTSLFGGKNVSTDYFTYCLERGPDQVDEVGDPDE